MEGNVWRSPPLRESHPQPRWSKTYLNTNKRTFVRAGATAQRVLREHVQYRCCEIVYVHIPWYTWVHVNAEYEGAGGHRTHRMYNATRRGPRPLRECSDLHASGRCGAYMYRPLARWRGHTGRQAVPTDAATDARAARRVGALGTDMSHMRRARCWDAWVSGWTGHGAWHPAQRERNPPPRGRRRRHCPVPVAEGESRVTAARRPTAPLATRRAGPPATSAAAGGHERTAVTSLQRARPQRPPRR